MPCGRLTPKPDPRKRLTIKQARLVEWLPHARTQREAAILAGYKDTPYARQAAQKAIISIRRKMPDILEELGVTPEAVAYKNLLPLMNATTIKFLKDDTEFVELADNATRLKALDLYYKLMGSYAPKEQITQQATTVRAIVLDAIRPKLPPPNNGKSGDSK